MRYKNKNMLSVLLLLFLNIFFGIAWFSQSRLNVLAVLGLVTVIVAVYGLGWGLLSFIIAATTLVCIACWVQFTTGQSYGLLAMNLVPLDMRQILIVSYIYVLVLTWIGILLNIHDGERMMVHIINQRYMSRSSIFFCNLVAVVFTIVAFPRIGYVSGSERFDMLLPGHGWNQLAVLGLIFNMQYLKTDRSVQLTYIFCVTWFLIHGERVDVVGLIIGLSIYFLNSGVHFSMRKVVRVIGLLGIFGLVMIIIGDSRNGGKIPSLTTLLSSIFTFSTVSDVGYLLTVSVQYIKDFPLLNGKLMLSNLFKILPFMSTNTDFPSTISNLYMNPGGEPLVSSGYMDYGMFGVFLEAAIDAMVVKVNTAIHSDFWAFEYMLLMCSAPRLAWYGRSYVFTGMFFFIPFLYYMTSELTKRSRMSLL